MDPFEATSALYTDLVHLVQRRDSPLAYLCSQCFRSITAKLVIPRKRATESVSCVLPPQNGEMEQNFVQQVSSLFKNDPSKTHTFTVFEYTNTRFPRYRTFPTTYQEVRQTDIVYIGGFF